MSQAMTVILILVVVVLVASCCARPSSPSSHHRLGSGPGPWTGKQDPATQSSCGYSSISVPRYSAV